MQGCKNVVEQSTAEGVSQNGILRNPKMPNKHFCANRVLSDGFAFPIVFELFYKKYVLQFLYTHNFNLLYLFQNHKVHLLDQQPLKTEENLSLP